MAHFTYETATPNLPDYLFEADLVVSIIVPQSFTVVPTSDGQVYIHWAKHRNTSDSASDLYAQVYRSTDLDTWTLVASQKWATTDEYTDSDVDVSSVYYYRIRFVRLDALGVVTNTSNYTVPLAAKVVTSLGFEPRDTYSNKFFQFLLSGLPGTRIYDRTEAAHFSSNVEHLWQTTCRMLDGFNVFVDGSVAHTEPADSSALYSKREISFLMDKKHSKLTSIQESTGATGDTVHVNAYLIHTFLMAYASQFLTLYEKYFQVVADKFIDYSQIYTKGFKPVVSDQKDISLADLWYSFGNLLGLQPLKAQETSQGFVKYKDMLKSSFTNQDNVGKMAGITQACQNTLGITTQTILEYYKQHWFKSDREHKLYVMPSTGDPYAGYVNPSSSLATPDNGLEFLLNDDRFWATIWYTSNSPYASGDLQVLGSSPENPYSYLFNVRLGSGGATTANNVIDLFSWNSVANSIVTVNNSGGSPGTGLIPYISGHDGILLRMHSPWIGWEDSLVKMYSKSFQLKDAASYEITGTDNANFSATISAIDPTVTFPPSGGTVPSSATQKDAWDDMESDDLIIARDDSSEGVSYYDGAATEISLSGEKRILFKINLTTSKMEWTKRAVLKIFINHSSEAGYLRLYRIRKKYDTSKVCWNYRDQESISGGYSWDALTEEYTNIPEDWVTKDWGTDGAKTSSDAVFLKEFYIPKISIDSPAWASIDVTDIIQDIYKYEVSRLNMGEDPENILETGFMLTAESYSNRSLISIKGHTNSTLKPKISWEKHAQGFHTVSPDSIKYYYIDGTTRYGRLLVKESSQEPISYIKTVHERIYQEDIKYSSNVSLILSSAPPAEFTFGVKLYGETSKAVGELSSVTNKTLNVSMQLKSFSVGETIRLLSDETVTATISSISYSGDKYVKLSRVPTSGSIIRVYHTGVQTTPATAPSEYPSYMTEDEDSDGIAPKFVSTASGTLNNFAERDTNSLDIINLNASDSVSTIGDVIVTYQYQYDYILLGRAVSDSDSVYDLEGCNRIGNGLFSQIENDYLYKTEVMLPMASTGNFVDISGDSTQDEYSDFNLGVLSDAIKNIRRYNGLVDVFKYQPEDKPYRFGHLYHKFLKRV